MEAVAKEEAKWADAREALQKQFHEAQKRLEREGDVAKKWEHLQKAQDASAGLQEMAVGLPALRVQWEYAPPGIHLIPRML